MLDIRPSLQKPFTCELMMEKSSSLKIHEYLIQFLNPQKNFQANKNDFLKKEFLMQSNELEYQRFFD